MKRFATYIFSAVFSLLVLTSVQEAYACTSVIISGRARADGRPLMWKNRDTDSLANSVRHYKGEKYSFISLVNTGCTEGESWIGVNTAGFAVMNTASYCLKDDDVPASSMDREGRVMYRALEICATLEDFEHFLDTLSRPMGVEANFGCIDAHGGAAWYETGNFSWHKIDVNDCPGGYMVVTNFSLSGPEDRWKGVERYKTASVIFAGMERSGSLASAGSLDIIDSLSRSYRHEVLGIDLIRDSAAFFAGTTGLAVDQDFIPRKSTSASVVITGAREGDDPQSCVMWAALGYPPCSVAVPVPVSAIECVPESLEVLCRDSSFCGLSSWLKKRYIFTSEVSSMSRYADLRPVIRGLGGALSLISCSRDCEDRISRLFLPIWSDYIKGRISVKEYISRYMGISSCFFNLYLKSFKSYILEDDLPDMP